LGPENSSKIRLAQASKPGFSENQKAQIDEKLPKSENTLKLSASICVASARYLRFLDRRLVQLKSNQKSKTKNRESKTGNQPAPSPLKSKI